MYKPILNKGNVLKFKRFSNRGYSLFAVLGKEVVIGVLSVATLQNATAKGISIETEKADQDTIMAKTMLLDEVEVRATRAPLAFNEQVRMVTVLTHEQIATAPVQSVNDLLKYVSSVDVRQKGALGVLTDVSIRGGNAEQIAVLLNGIHIGDAQTGHNAFDFPVDVNEIERIEVLEGPAGRAYGTSSLLGTINIITKNPSRPSYGGHLRGGSYGFFNAGLHAHFASPQWRNQFSASYTRSDGYLRNKQGGLSADFRAVKFFYAGTYDTDRLRLRWQTGLSQKDFGSNTFYSSRFDNQFEHTLKTFAAVQGENKVGALRIRPAVYWNRTYDRFELIRSAPDKYPFNYHRTDVYGLNLNTYFDWQLGRTALSGEVRQEEILSTNLGYPLEYLHTVSGADAFYVKGLHRTNLQFFAEHNVLLRRWTFSGGLLAVKNSQADMPLRFYPSLDISYQLTDGLRAYFSYNTSLRMPSFTELFYSVGGHKADPNLAPEELEAVEVGLKYGDARFTGKFNVFHNRHKNLIDWISDGTMDASGTLIWKSVNFGRITTVGFQSSFDIKLSHLFRNQRVLQSLSLSYAFLHQNQKDYVGIVSKYALEYLKNKFVARLDMALLPQLLLTTSYRFQHRMGTYLDVAGGRHSYASYALVDARLSWQARGWTAYVETNNVFNRSYVDYGNVPQPGRWFVGGFSVTL